LPQPSSLIILLPGTSLLFLALLGALAAGAGGAGVTRWAHKDSNLGPAD
jgi:hypothetical protein